MLPGLIYICCTNTYDCVCAWSYLKYVRVDSFFYYFTITDELELIVSIHVSVAPWKQSTATPKVRTSMRAQ